MKRTMGLCGWESRQQESNWLRGEMINEEFLVLIAVPSIDMVVDVRVR